jgi:septal ring factor EnvC (AmiA/AmiB activator)
LTGNKRQWLLQNYLTLFCKHCGCRIRLLYLRDAYTFIFPYPICSRQKKLIERLREAQLTIETLRSELAQSNDAVAEAQAAAAAVAASQSSAHTGLSTSECQTDLTGSVVSSDVQTQLQAHIAATEAEQQQLQQKADVLAQQLAWEQQQRTLAGSVLDAARQQEEQAAVMVRGAQAQCDLKIDSYKRTNARLEQVIDRLEDIVLSQQKCMQRGRHHAAATAATAGENRAPSRGDSLSSSRQQEPRRSTQQQQQQHRSSDADHHRRHSRPQRSDLSGTDAADDREHAEYSYDEHAHSAPLPPPRSAVSPPAVRARTGRPPLAQQRTGAHTTTPTVDVRVSCSWPPAGLDNAGGSLLQHRRYEFSSEHDDDNDDEPG